MEKNTLPVKQGAIFLVLAIVFIVFLSSLASAVLFDNTAYYNFNSTTGTNLWDITNNGNNGTTFNTPTWTTGILNKALSFTNTSLQYANITHELFNQPSQSISVWIKPGFNINDLGRYYVWDATGDSSLMLFNQGRLQIYAGGTQIFNLDPVEVNKWLKNTTWVNLVVTYTSGTNNLYVNGGLYNYTSATLWTKSATNSLTFGATALLDAGFYYNGSVDEWGIWSRLLNYQDVVDLYKGGTGLGYVSNAPYIQNSINYPSTIIYETSTSTYNYSINVTPQTYPNQVSARLFVGGVEYPVSTSNVSTSWYYFSSNFFSIGINPFE